MSDPDVLQERQVQRVEIRIDNHRSGAGLLVKRDEIDVESVKKRVETFPFDTETRATDIDSVPGFSNRCPIRFRLIERSRIDVNSSKWTRDKFLRRSRSPFFSFSDCFSSFFSNSANRCSRSLTRSEEADSEVKASFSPPTCDRSESRYEIPPSAPSSEDSTASRLLVSLSVVCCSTAYRFADISGNIEQTTTSRRISPNPPHEVRKTLRKWNRTNDTTLDLDSTTATPQRSEPTAIPAKIADPLPPRKILRT